MEHIGLVCWYIGVIADDCHRENVLYQVKKTLKEMFMHGYTKHIPVNMSYSFNRFAIVLDNLSIESWFKINWRDGVKFPLNDKEEYKRIIKDCYANRDFVFNLLERAFVEGCFSTQPYFYNNSRINSIPYEEWLDRYWIDNTSILDKKCETIISPSSKCTLEEARRLFSRR